MRVGIDGRSLSGSGAGRGVAHYTSALLHALATEHPADDWHVLVPRGPVREPPAAPNVHVHRSRLPGRALYGLSGVLGRPHLDALLGGVRPDVFWAPAPAPLTVSQDVPLALTLHDLSWVQRPQDFTAYERAWHRLARPERLAHRAAIVVAVSGATRDEAVAAWALDPAQVAVVHSGVDRPGRQAPGAAARRPRPYLLFVGALEPRKAPDVLVRAFARARARGLDADLLLAGEGRLGSALSGPGVHVLGPVSAGRRDELYAGALAVVLPSYLEGFGFPPLEGLAAGVPAVVSDLPVFRELLGAAALRVAPGDEAGLADALLRIAADERLRAELVDAGRPTVVGLTWERAARATRAALARAAGIEA